MEPSMVPSPKRRRWWNWFLPGFLLFILLVLFLPRFHTRAASSSSPASDTTVRVIRKDFAPALRLNGTTQAARSYVATTPILEGAQINTMVITKLISSGSRVKTGDILVEFDPQAQMKDFLDKQNTFVSLSGQVAQKKADEEIAKAKDDSALKQAEDDLSRAKLEVQKNEIVSRIDAEKNQEALEEADATLKQLRETYEHKRASAQAAIRMLELQRDRAQEAMHYAQGNSSRMSLRSPMDGVAVFNTLWLSGRMRTVQLGDSVRPGMPILQVVDPSKMQVHVNVNQVDLTRLSVGQHAQIHLDAYPGLVFPGVLQQLSPVGHNGTFSDTIRNFSAMFQIQGDDPRLLPDLSAAIDLDFGKQDKALVIPRDALVEEGDKAFVYRQNGASFEKHAVHVSLMGDGEVAVDSGLSEGDVVKRQADGATGKAGK
jgi:HlyD family secretion protein